MKIRKSHFMYMNAPNSRKDDIQEVPRAQALKRIVRWFRNLSIESRKCMASRSENLETSPFLRTTHCYR